MIALAGAALLAAIAVLVLLPSTSDGRARRICAPAPTGTPRGWQHGMSRIIGRVGVGPASRRRRAAQRMHVVRALATLAAELEAGQPPREALRRAAGDPPAWPRALASLRFDGDVAAALEADGDDRPVLAHLAACWRVATESGTGLAAAVARLAESARTAEDARVDLEGQLAGPRATARLLALLPVVGIGFGVLLGSDPLGWLLTEPLGRICLGLGVLLTAAGAWWTGRIAASVERLL